MEKSLLKVEYTVPINGVCDFAFRESVQPDSLGNFQITITVAEPTFLKLLIFGKSQGTLLVESGESYDVNFDLNSKEDKFKVLGKNQKGQNAYKLITKFGIYSISSQRV